MSRREQDAFIEVMAGPVTEGLPAVEVDQDEAPVIRWARCMQRVLYALESIDLSRTPTPTPQDDSIGDIASPIDTRIRCEQLMQAAFDDVFTLTRLCEQVAIDRQLTLDSGFAEILRRSKGNLLLAARLWHKHETDLLEMLQRPGMWYGRDDVDFPDKPIHLEEMPDGTMLFDWDPTIRAWIEARFIPEAGCPAGRKIVSTDQGEQPLIYFFWDELIDKMYAP